MLIYSAAFAIAPALMQVVGDALSFAFSPIAKLKERFVDQSWVRNALFYFACLALFVFLFEWTGMSEAWKRLDIPMRSWSSLTGADRAIQVSIFISALIMVTGFLCLILEGVRFVREFTVRLLAEPNGLAVAPASAIPANDYPVLHWSQEVGAGETIGGAQQRAATRMMMAFPIVCAAIGYYLSAGEGALIGFFVGCWMAALGPREAQAPDLRLPLVGNSVSAPRQSAPLSEDDRRALAEPVTRREDCAAFVIERDDCLDFCVARAAPGEGQYTIMDAVPYDSFQNFEEGSHRHWFRRRSSSSNMVDWGVIVAQSNVGRVMRVAESVNDHASLTELLVKLQNTFIVPREQYLREFREKKANAGNDAARAGPPPADKVPNTPF